MACQSADNASDRHSKHSTSLQQWTAVPTHLLHGASISLGARTFSTSTQRREKQPKLTHLTEGGNAHMVSISSKEPTKRTAVAVCSIHFSNPLPIELIRENGNKKGDVIGVARIAGIMAAKQTSSLIPLCHPIAITHVSIDLDIAGLPSQPGGGVQWAGTGQGDAYSWDGDWKPSPGLDVSGVQKVKQPSGRIDISATVSCDGKTGVEMEALMAASATALTVYDMCKAVDKGMRIEGLKVIRKEGGKSGTWIEGQKQ